MLSISSGRKGKRGGEKVGDGAYLIRPICREGRKREGNEEVGRRRRERIALARKGSRVRKEKVTFK